MDIFFTKPYTQILLRPYVEDTKEVRGDGLGQNFIHNNSNNKLESFLIRLQI